MEKSLTGKYIYDKLKGKIKLMTYDELMKYNSIDSLFGNKDAIVILFESKEGRGHWTLLFKRLNGNIEFFDSYGIIPDDQFDFIDSKFIKRKKIVTNHLTKLLFNSNKKIEYNDHPLQKIEKGVSTCGRWVILRYLKKNMNIDDFAKFFFDQYYPPDIVVTLIEQGI